MNMNLTECYSKYELPNHRKTLNYLADLANTVGVDLSEWDIVSTFGDGDALVGSPTELNKRFFEKMKTQALVKKDMTLTEEQLKTLSRFEAGAIKALQSDVDQEINSAINSIRGWAQRQEEAQLTLKRSFEKKRSLTFSIIDQINEINSQGFFSFFLVDDYNKAVIFNSKPVVLSYKRNDGVEFRVPMGTFRLHIYPTNARVALYKDTNNVIYDAHYHPFVAYHGRICWGTGSEIASRLIAEGKYSQIANLLASLLTTYPGTTPYVALETFYIYGKNSMGEQPWRTNKEIKTTFPDQARLNRNECSDCGQEYCGDEHECPPERES
jgi:hypothetical protein